MYTVLSIFFQHVILINLVGLRWGFLECGDAHTHTHTHTHTVDFSPILKSFFVVVVVLRSRSKKNLTFFHAFSRISFKKWSWDLHSDDKVSWWEITISSTHFHGFSYKKEVGNFFLVAAAEAAVGTMVFETHTHTHTHTHTQTVLIGENIHSQNVNICGTRDLEAN